MISKMRKSGSASLHGGVYLEKAEFGITGTLLESKIRICFAQYSEVSFWFHWVGINLVAQFGHEHGFNRIINIAAS